MFKKEFEILVLLGVLEVANDSEWVSPSFSQLKPESNRVHFLSDFMNTNKQLKQKPYPMPTMNEGSKHFFVYLWYWIYPQEDWLHILF